MSPPGVVVIGKSPIVAGAVRKGLEPEYDVIHILTSAEQALEDLPLLLSEPSKTPANTEDNLGSKNYGTRPRIIAIGGGHSEESFTEMRRACKDVEKGIVWLKRDLSKMTSKPDLSKPEAYGLLTAQHMKEALNKLDLDDSETEGIHYF